MPLLRYNLAPTFNGKIASLPSHSHAWIVPDDSIDFPALYAQFSHFIMGRKTYETFLALPEGENPLAGRDKGSVIVVSSSRLGGEWMEGVTVMRAEEVVGVVRELKGSAEKDIWLMGGGELAGLLMRAGLVDVVEAAVMPVVVEKGVEMFGEGRDGDGERVWKLVLEKAEALESGILMTRYRVVYD